MKDAEKFGVCASEASEEDFPVGNGAKAQLQAIVQKFGLSPKRAEALQEYVSRDGLVYVLEKAAIVRSRPRRTVKAGIGGGVTPSGYHPQRRGLRTTSTVQPSNASAHANQSLAL